MQFEVTVAGEIFQGGGKLILKEGFRKFMKREAKAVEKDEGQAELPDIREGDTVTGHYWIKRLRIMVNMI